MDIIFEERESRKDIKLIRRLGFIPAVVYDNKGNAVSVKIEQRVFEAHLREIEKGGLATVTFQVTFGKEKFKAIVKDVSYHRTTYNLQHVDFMKVEDNDRVSINIPVVLKGEDSSKVIVEGGKLKKVKRSVKTSLLVKEIPRHFIIDATNIGIGDQIRVADLTLTSSMVLQLHEKQVLVSGTK